MPLKLIRFWVPLSLTLGGLVVVLVSGVTESGLAVGIPILSAGLSVWLLNFLYRVGVAGDVDRDRENEARAYFARYGQWPADEADGLPGGSR